MTKNEIIEKLFVICKNKLKESINLQNNDKIQIYDAILNILNTPNFFNKQDIEVTINILKDLDIEENYITEIIRVFMKED